MKNTTKTRLFNVLWVVITFICFVSPIITRVVTGDTPTLGLFWRQFWLALGGCIFVFCTTKSLYSRFISLFVVSLLVVIAVIVSDSTATYKQANPNDPSINNLHVDELVNTATVTRSYTRLGEEITESNIHSASAYLDDGIAILIYHNSITHPECVTIIDDLSTYLERNNVSEKTKIYTVFTDSEMGKTLLQKYPSDNVPSLIYVTDNTVHSLSLYDNDYNSFSRRSLDDVVATITRK